MLEKGGGIKVCRLLSLGFVEDFKVNACCSAYRSRSHPNFCYMVAGDLSAHVSLDGSTACAAVA